MEHKQQEQYIKYIIARWGAYYNLIFNVAGPEPLLNGKPEHKAGYKNSMEISDIDRIAGWIRKYDVFNHLITVHNETRASENGDPFRDFPWYGFSTIQGPKTNDLEKHRKTIFRIRHPEKPWFAQETLWSGNMYHPEYGPENTRKIAIVLTMNAAMINFADNRGNSSSGFSGNLNLDDRNQEVHNQLIRVWDFFETIPFGEMKPDTLIAPSEFVLAGKKEILVYTDKPGEIVLNIPDLKNYNGTWLNARNTNESWDAGTILPGKPLRTPGEAGDWFLKITIQEICEEKKGISFGDDHFSKYFHVNEGSPGSGQFRTELFSDTDTTWDKWQERGYQFGFDPLLTPMYTTVNGILSTPYIVL